MKKLGYSDLLSGPTISAGGTLGILIPPSMGFVLLGILAELSIGKLFIAGIIPGLIVVCSYIALVAILCKIKPELAPGTAASTWGEKFGSIKLTGPLSCCFSLLWGAYMAVYLRLLSWRHWSFWCPDPGYCQEATQTRLYMVLSPGCGFDDGHDYCHAGWSLHI